MESLSRNEMHRLTRSLSTKADKIRALGRAGVGPAEIGRFLGIRYQHAYNVLKRSGISPGGDAVRDLERAAASAPAKAVLDETGRILLPQRILETWSASPGEDLLVRIEGDELRVLTRSAGLRLARDILRKYPPAAGKAMADELIAERRREAERDDG
jgi:bifunctional DNA-binding transcriptional regulator/antitoxin component of YhaV-PrlF toxin-antitoxin module